MEFDLLEISPVFRITKTMSKGKELDSVIASDSIRRGRLVRLAWLLPGLAIVAVLRFHDRLLRMAFDSETITFREYAIYRGVIIAVVGLAIPVSLRCAVRVSHERRDLMPNSVSRTLRVFDFVGVFVFGLVSGALICMLRGWTIE